MLTALGLALFETVKVSVWFKRKEKCLLSVPGGAEGCGRGTWKHGDCTVCEGMSSQ